MVPVLKILCVHAGHRPQQHKDKHWTMSSSQVPRNCTKYAGTAVNYL